MMALVTILGGGLLAACATQQEMPGSANVLQASAAEAPDAETVQEIKGNAQQVSLTDLPRDSEIVCQRITPTGSLIPKRRCMTRAALREVTEQAQEWLRSDGERGSVTEAR